MEGLEVAELLPHRGEGDGPADHLLDRERRATPGVAVELGEDHAVDGQDRVERLGHIHRVLAGHGVDDEERVVRVHRLGDAPGLVHEVLVDVEAAGGVDDQHVLAQALGLFEAGPGHGLRVGGLGKNRDTGLSAQHPQLLDGGRALKVGPYQERVAPLGAEPLGQLAAGGGLTGALEAGQHHDRRRP